MQQAVYVPRRLRAIQVFSKHSMPPGCIQTDNLLVRSKGGDPSVAIRGATAYMLEMIGEYVGLIYHFYTFYKPAVR